MELEPGVMEDKTKPMENEKWIVMARRSAERRPNLEGDQLWQKS
jgi:hypothetical protein